jgi:hypothetical protein
MKKILPLLFSLSFILQKTDAQVGGEHIYEFLNHSNSARVTGLAGNLITVKDDDVALAYSNPSLLNAEMHQELTFNYNFHLSDISNGYFGYAHHLKKQDLTLHILLTENSIGLIILEMSMVNLKHQNMH